MHIVLQVEELPDHVSKIQYLDDLCLDSVWIL